MLNNNKKIKEIEDTFNLIINKSTDLLSSRQLDKKNKEFFINEIKNHKEEIEFYRNTNLRGKREIFKGFLRNIYYIFSLLTFIFYVKKKSIYKRKKNLTQIQKNSFKKIEFTSNKKMVDEGGIFEKYLCSSNNTYPPHVARDLYTTSLALVLFQHETYKKNFLSAFSFLINKEMVNRRVEHDHIEFDNFALSLIKNKKVKNFIIKNSSYTEYCPINVIAMRLATYRKDILKRPILYKLFIWSSLNAINSSQNTSGLIDDSTLSSRKDSNDTSYSWFTVACLIIFDLENNFDLSTKIIYKKCIYAKLFQSSSGSFSFSGRAGNSSYHEAGAILLMTYGMYKFNIDFLDQILLSSKRLASYLTDEGLPTSLSFSKFIFKSGWHGSCLQYTALSSVLLKKALDLIKDKINVNKINRLNKNLEIFKRIKNNTQIQKIEISDTSLIGIKKCYIDTWQAGEFTTGFGGVASFSIRKEEIFANLFYSNRHKIFIGFSNFKNAKYLKVINNALNFFGINNQKIGSLIFDSENSLIINFSNFDKSYIGIREDFAGGNPYLEKIKENKYFFICNKNKKLIIKDADYVKFYNQKIETPSGFAYILEVATKNKIKFILEKE